MKMLHIEIPCTPKRIRTSIPILEVLYANPLHHKGLYIAEAVRLELTIPLWGITAFQEQALIQPDDFQIPHLEITDE